MEDMMQGHLEHIESLRVELAREVRAYCRAQLDIWRTIPWLAIEAEGRGGWSQRGYVAYVGLWPVNPGAPLSSLMVDCDSGELLWGLTMATDDHVFAMAAYLDRLDAKRVKEELTKLLSEKYTGRYGRDGYEAYERKFNDRKTTYRAARGIGKIYRRREKLPADWYEAAKLMY